MVRNNGIKSFIQLFMAFYYKKEVTSKENSKSISRT